MFTFFRRLKDSCDVLRLRRKARRNPAPRTVIDLCRGLDRAGRGAEALDVARMGAARFPHSIELEDVLREAWARHGAVAVAILKAKAQTMPTTAAFEVLVRAEIDAGLVEDAIADAVRMVEQFPDQARSHAMVGFAFQARFRREHLSKDGERALAAFKRATEMDRTSFEARRALAAAYAHIGATSQAMFHLLLALEQRSTDPELRALFLQLKGKPFERRPENELLWEAEVLDESRLDHRSLALDAEQLSEVTSCIAKTTAIDGVKSIALCHHKLEIVADARHAPRRVDGRGDRHVEMAHTLRQAASTAAKRLGFGAFHELDMTMQGRRLVALGAGPTVVMLELDPRAAADAVIDGMRDDLGRWTADAHRAMEWGR